MKIWSEPVRALPLQEPLVVAKDDPVVDVIKRMQKRGCGCACVVEGGKLVGVFTERDVMQKFVSQSVDQLEAVSAIMSPNPFVIRDDAPVSAAVELFHDEQIHHLPVMLADDSLLGLLSIRVVVDFFGENLPVEVLNLPPDSKIISTQESGG